MACACVVKCSTNGELMNMMIQVMNILNMMGYDIVSYSKIVKIKTRLGYDGPCMVKGKQEA
jgi:hypothetical protein